MDRPPSDVDAILDQLQPIIRSTAKNLLRHLAENPAAQAEGSFAELEALDGSLADALARERMSQALQQRADALAPAPPPSCPICRHLTEPRPPRTRTLRTDHGEVHWDEPEYYCGPCRKAFFPPDAATET